MKINGKKPGVGTDNIVKKVGEKDQVKQSNAGDASGAGDSVNISQRAMDLSRVKKMLESLPDVRGDMVVSLKSDIEQGSYSVDAGKVAEKMITKALRDSIYSRKPNKTNE